MRRALIAFLVLITHALVQNAAVAVPADLISNGGFESNGGVGQINGSISYATDWNMEALTDTFAQGFAFVMDNNADSSGAPSLFSPPNMMLWGPGSGVNNGFTVSPDGGDFLALSGSFSIPKVSQSVSGLQIGELYELSFYWALAQATDAQGDYQAGWNLTFGTDTATSGQQPVASKGFANWSYYTATFTAASTTQTLSFEAQGTAGVLPFVLLDGVSLKPVAVPEPSTYMLGGAATLILGWISRSKTKRQSSSSVA